MSNNNNICAADSIVASRPQNKIEYFLSYLPTKIGMNNKPVVAILRLDGMIGKVGAMRSGMTLNGLNKLIEDMFRIKNLDLVCLSINSPGGSPVQSELITNRIVELAKSKGVEVYSFIEDVAASGGYWLSCAGQKIYASRSSVIGSIGVISTGFGFHKAIGKMGIERRVYSEGDSKSVLDPFMPEKSSDLKIIGKIQTNIHKHFISTVKERRADRLTQNDNILFNGEFWSGETALDYGLIDGIDNLYSFLQRRYDNNVKIEYIKKKESWIKTKLGLTKITEEFSKDLSENIINSVEQRLISSKFDIK